MTFTDLQQRQIGPLVAQCPLPRVSPDATLREAVSLLAGGDVPAVVIDGPREPVRLVGGAELAAALCDGADPDAVWVADLPEQVPLYVRADDDLVQVVRAMVGRRTDAVLVVDEDGLVGGVSLVGALRAAGVTPEGPDGGAAPATP